MKIYQGYFSMKILILSLTLITFSLAQKKEVSHNGGLLIGMLNYLINFSGNNYIETDAGTATNGDAFFPAFGLGYRYCPKYGGFLFKIAFNIITYKNGHTFPFGGIGFGAAF